MPELGTSGSVGAAGEQSPAATRRGVYLPPKGLGWVAGLGRANTSSPPPSVTHQNQ
jgi:hypothetical protein